jgi:hypothetical protein
MTSIRFSDVMIPFLLVDRDDDHVGSSMTSRTFFLPPTKLIKLLFPELLMLLLNDAIPTMLSDADRRNSDDRRRRF